jgi:hypothetical protein
MVPGTPESEAARRKWASTAQEHLAAVAQAVDHLRKLFEIELATPVEADEAVASQVVSACSDLNGWLRSSHPPRGLRKSGWRARGGRRCLPERNGATGGGPKGVAHEDPSCRLTFVESDS